MPSARRIIVRVCHIAAIGFLLKNHCNRESCAGVNSEMKNGVFRVVACIWLMLFAAASAAGEYKVGDIVIEHPQIRATPPGAPVSAGYLVVNNIGTQADTLIAVNAPFSEKAEIHEMKMDDGVMKMRPLANGIEIPAGGQVTLKPGGRHLMFMKLRQNLKIGSRHAVTLRFQSAGEVVIDMLVVDPADLGHNTSEGDHSDQQNHSD